MSLEKSSKAVISVALFVLSLFLIVFFRMEERRLGYELLQTRNEEKILSDNRRQLMIQVANLNRPQRVESVANNGLSLRKAQSDQIVYLTEKKYSLLGQR